MYSRMFVSKNALATLMYFFPADRTRIALEIGPAFGDRQQPTGRGPRPPVIRQGLFEQFAHQRIHGTVALRCMHLGLANQIVGEAQGYVACRHGIIVTHKCVGGSTEATSCATPAAPSRLPGNRPPTSRNARPRARRPRATAPRTC